MSEQTETVRREFTRQAASFEARDSLFGQRSLLDWIGEHVPVPEGARILDVAGGTGRTGRHLARGDASAVIVDVTDAMLETGLRAVGQEGRNDVLFVRGDATALPFPAGQFDVVVSRFALHHMDDPGRAIAEMARVCREEGSVTLIDMMCGGAGHDRLERLRDPSHTRALREEELIAHLAAAGRTPKLRAEREHTTPVDGWLEQARTPEQERGAIIAELSAEADGGQATGLRAQRVDGALTITQTWVLLGA